MQTSTNAFAPFIDGSGLQLGVLPGVVLVGGTPTVIGNSSVSLSANATTYVYLNTSTGVITTSNSSFPSSNAYPIATVTTGRTGVNVMTDSRCDVASGGGGGSGVVLQTTTTLTAAQMNGLVETPITLISAVAGSIINPLSVLMVYKFGSAAFSNPPQLDISYGSLGSSIFASALTGFVDQTSSQAFASPVFTGGAANPLTVWQNTAVTVENTNGSDSTSGTGSVLEITIPYTLVTVT